MNVDGVAGTAPGTAVPPAAADRAAREFEAFLIRALLKSARAALPSGGFLGCGRGGELFADLLDARRAEQASRQGPVTRAAILDRYAGAADPPRGVHLDLRAGSIL